MDALVSSDVFLFDRFRLHRRSGRLLRRDPAGVWQPVAIGSRALDALGVLLERHGHLVSKDESIPRGLVRCRGGGEQPDGADLRAAARPR